MTKNAKAAWKDLLFFVLFSTPCQTLLTRSFANKCHHVQPISLLFTSFNPFGFVFDAGTRFYNGASCRVPRVYFTRDFCLFAPYARLSCAETVYANFLSNRCANDWFLLGQA